LTKVKRNKKKTVEKWSNFFVQAGIEAWTKALEGSKGGVDTDDTMDTDSPTMPAHKLGGDPQIKKSYHDIRITNQVTLTS
jgi:hypothetical protein